MRPWRCSTAPSLSASPTQPITDRMRAAHIRDVAAALKQGVINADEAAQLESLAKAVSRSSPSTISRRRN